MEKLTVVQTTIAGIYAAPRQLTIPPTDARLRWDEVRGLFIEPSSFQCCGATSIRQFGRLNCTSFAAKAMLLSTLWKESRGTRHYVYVINNNQKRQKNYEHAALKECGAVEVAKFPNMQPGHGNLLYLFVIDLNMGIGKFFDHNGNPFKEPPKKATAQRACNIVLPTPPQPPKEAKPPKEKK